MQRTPNATARHPSLHRARRLTGRRGPRPLRIPLPLNLGRATLLAAALLGLRLVL